MGLTSYRTLLSEKKPKKNPLSTVTHFCRAPALICVFGSCVICLFKKNEAVEKEEEEDVVVIKKKKVGNTSGTCKTAVRWDSATRVTTSAPHDKFRH